MREFVLDNVPFFAKEATLGDTVLVREDNEGHRWFEAVLQRSGNSLIRVVFFDRTCAAGVSDHLEGLGCTTEHFTEHNLLAISIPETVRATDVQAYLQAEAGRGILDYEEPILRQ